VKVVTIGLNLFFLESTFKVHHKNTKNVGGSMLVCELQALVWYP